MNIIIAIIIGLIIVMPSLISIIIYKRKNELKWFYSGVSLSLLTSVTIFFLVLTILTPSTTFDQIKFKQNYFDIFKSELPATAQIIKKQYSKDVGLFGNEYWTTRLLYTQTEYLKLLHIVKCENEMLLKDYSKNPKPDCLTGDNIIYSIKTRYMNPHNYEIDFFEDMKTIRLKIIIMGD